MLKFTDAACGVSATPSYSYPFGPYLTQMPPNPLNGKNKVLVVTGPTMPPADDSQPYGWIYNVDLQRIQVNLTGNDTTGSPYANY